MFFKIAVVMVTLYPMLGCRMMVLDPELVDFKYLQIAVAKPKPDVPLSYLEVVMLWVLLNFSYIIGPIESPKLKYSVLQIIISF